ncbi:murein transglycosylase [Saccharibacter sp. 17.LH.SD]|nr:murein transglycosylase [Saccharibacter sp. 17.LH.SD]
MKCLWSPLGLALLLTACVSDVPAGEMTIAPVGYESLIGWNADSHTALVGMLRDECHRLAQLPPKTTMGGASSLPYGRKAGDWAGVCAALPASESVTEESARNFFELWFQPYEIQETVLYTGYYEPQVEASLTRGGEYQTPLYRRPPDLLRGRTDDGKVVFGHWVNSVFQPYDDRATIDGGALNNKNLEVAWLKSPIDLYVLQLQGAGRLHLPDGQVLRVAYDGRNGQPYVPIGKILVQRGAMSAVDVNAETIRAWLEAHPQESQELLEKNPNYVFFRTVDRSEFEGPGGALGVPLVPGRSLAVDRAYVPFAAPVWVETAMLDSQGKEGSWHHTTFAQDVGTDIRGAGRGDLFTGWGDMARTTAGHLRSSGRMVILLPRPPAQPVSNPSSLDFPSK